MNVNKEWLLATLGDLQECLDEALERLEREPDDHEFDDTALEEFHKLYAKLNFAYNTRELGQEAFGVLDDDELIGLPAGELPFLVTGLDEEEEEDETVEEAPRAS